jgi:hypothetical protein
MDAVITLMATLVGAGIVLFGQWILERRQRAARFGELLLEQSALLLALNDDFDNRLWEERVLGLAGRVDSWDLASSRLAKAKLEILKPDPRLERALIRLHSTGVSLGDYWRRHHADDRKLEKFLADHQAACHEFREASSAPVRKVFGV